MLKPNAPRIAVISCWKYRDAWLPFFTLFNRFWSDCPYSVDLVTDTIADSPTYLFPASSLPSLQVCSMGACLSWCEVVTLYCHTVTDPILFLQEDFFLTESPNWNLINEGLYELNRLDAGCVRLYPCPGDVTHYGNLHFGLVSHYAPYRISCQAAWWNPAYLRLIASRYSSPQDFEIQGTKFSKDLTRHVLSFKREIEVDQWPLHYICTGIVRGKWQRSALDLCAYYNIPVDTSLRETDMESERLGSL